MKKRHPENYEINFDATDLTKWNIYLQIASRRLCGDTQDDFVEVNSEKRDVRGETINE